MTRRLILCTAALLLAGACTTTGGHKDRGRHRADPPKQALHEYDCLRSRMLLAAGVMRACGRHNDARRAIWNATVTNKRPKRRGRWSGRRIGKAARLSTDGAVRRRIDGRLRCRSFEVMRRVHRIDTTHSRLRLRYPQARPPGPVTQRPAGRSGSEPARRQNRDRGDPSRREKQRS